jgi:hypothetical protein
MAISIGSGSSQHYEHEANWCIGLLEPVMEFQFR